MNWKSGTQYLVKDIYYCYHIVPGSNEALCCLTVKVWKGGVIGEKVLCVWRGR